MKYLVDLNYTLVGNSPKWGEPRITPFSRQIEQETYRQWLVDFLRDKYAILITARPIRYKEQTLARIFSQTNWQPQESYFAGIFRLPLTKSKKTYCYGISSRNTVKMARISSESKAIRKRERCMRNTR